MKDLQAEESENKEAILGEEWVGCCKVTFLQGTKGVSWADYLTSADQVIPD